MKLIFALILATFSSLAISSEGSLKSICYQPSITDDYWFSMLVVQDKEELKLYECRGSMSSCQFSRKLERFVIGEPQVSGICLGTYDQTEFSLCTGHNVAIRQTARGNLVELQGVRMHDVEFDTYCDTNILQMLQVL